MIIIIVLAVLLTATMVILAYRLAAYTLPTLLGFGVARLADATGAGWVGAGIAGVLAGMLSFYVFAVLFATARTPTVRAVVALIFVAPAVAAGYMLAYGLTEGAVPSSIWRLALCFAAGAFVGSSAFARLGRASNAAGKNAANVELIQSRYP